MTDSGKKVWPGEAFLDMISFEVEPDQEQFPVEQTACAPAFIGTEYRLSGEIDLPLAFAPSLSLSVAGTIVRGLAISEAGEFSFVLGGHIGLRARAKTS